MKILISVLIFATTLTFGVQSLASAGEELAKEMNSLFPPPQANTSLSQPPAKPELESPPFFQKLTETKVVLKWKEAPDAPAYHVQVATDPNFKWLVKEEHLFKGTSLEISGLEAGKHYFWRVAGVKPDNKAGDIKGAYSSSMFEAVAQ